MVIRNMKNLFKLRQSKALRVEPRVVDLQRLLKVSVITNFMIGTILLLLIGYFFVMPFIMFGGDNDSSQSESVEANPRRDLYVVFCADQRKNTTADELLKLGPPLYDCNATYTEAGHIQSFWISIKNQSGVGLSNIKLSLSSSKGWSIVSAPKWAADAKDSALVHYVISDLSSDQEVRLPVTFKAPVATVVSTPGILKFENVNKNKVSDAEQPPLTQPSVNVYVPDYVPR
jgi:hypothetical protein